MDEAPEPVSRRSNTVCFQSLQHPEEPPCFLARDPAGADGAARLTSVSVDLWACQGLAGLPAVGEMVLLRAATGYRVTVVSVAEALWHLAQDW